MKTIAPNAGAETQTRRSKIASLALSGANAAEGAERGGGDRGVASASDAAVSISGKSALNFEIVS